MYPYNRKMGQTIQTDVDNVSVDRAFLAHFQVLAALALAASNAGIHAAITLGAEAVDVATGITNPAVPRNVTVKGNVSGVIDDVVVTGTDYAGDAIEETITLNGTSVVAGAKAFKTITSINVPAQTHTPAAQTETITVTAAVTEAGNITLAITAAALGEDSPLEVVVALTTDEDDVTKTAAAMVAALNLDETFAAVFTASNEAGVITITANTPAANDATLAVAFTDTDTTSVTMGESTNGTAGVAYDTATIGWGDILGLPFLLSHNTVLAAYLDNALEATAPTVAVSATAVSGNTIDLNSALNGKNVDVYLIC